MYARSALRSSILPILMASCAMGEPLDELHVLELGTNHEHAFHAGGQLFIEVADRDGRPLEADSVWITVDDGDFQPAACMADGQGGCETWLADVEPVAGHTVRGPKVTVFAEVCGLLYLETLMPEEAFTVSAHLVVVADDASCHSAHTRRRG